MNTPTPRTDAATHPADCLGKTLVTNRDCPCALERELTALTAERDQLRAEVEAITDTSVKLLASLTAERAEAERTDAIYQRACEVEQELRADLAIEREKSERYRLASLKLDAELTGAYTCIHHNDQQRAACPVCLVTALTAERDSLRTQVEQKRNLLTVAIRSAGDQEKRASRAEADLATERARLDWLESPAGVDWQWSSSALTIRRAVIDAAMKEDAK